MFSCLFFFFSISSRYRTWLFAVFFFSIITSSFEGGRFRVFGLFVFFYGCTIAPLWTSEHVRVCFILFFFIDAEWNTRLAATSAPSLFFFSCFLRRFHLSAHLLSSCSLSLLWFDASFPHLFLVTCTHARTLSLLVKYQVNILDGVCRSPVFFSPLFFLCVCWWMYGGLSLSHFQMRHCQHYYCFFFFFEKINAPSR